ncbi:hypothetical protein CLOM_g264 [Closterium sp. NIES-68]|nr:hypothetical protein CLOM_g264 [Closterium sp. NIES-68]GJP77735.1 hypothetical protein CLOP_g8090 [Closterium sp. NIES-67]
MGQAWPHGIPPAFLPRVTPLPRGIPVPRTLSLPHRLRPPFTSFRDVVAALFPLLLLTSIALLSDSPCHVALAATLDVLTPKGGCLTSRCVSYTRGRWLLASGTASTIMSVNGNLNYERYKISDSSAVLLRTNTINENSCCQLCAQADKCIYFHFQPPLVSGNGVCRLLTDLSKFTVDNTITSTAPSYIGGKCNPLAEVKNDPHFVGAEGTRFDFHGDLDRSFCLLTDRDLHINMGIKGYEDARMAVGGRRGGGGGKRRSRLPIRSWIRELYLTWRDSTGQQHSVFLRARDGREQARGESGFIERMEVDGRPLIPPTQVAQAVHLEGGFQMVLVAAEALGDGRDKDTYRVVVQDLLFLQLSVHAAHPLLQTADEAHTHFNVYVKYLNNTEAVHGVLGQTFRGEITRAKRAEEYGLLTRLLRAPIQADGDTGRGYLDGDVEDYTTSSINAADCTFATAWNEAWREAGEEPGEVRKEIQSHESVKEEGQQEAREESHGEQREDVRPDSEERQRVEHRKQGIAGRVDKSGEKGGNGQDDLTEGVGERKKGIWEDAGRVWERIGERGNFAAENGAAGLPPREQLVFEIFQ